MERSIHVDKAEYAAELFGSFDVNAKRLEKAFGVTFSCRDSQIHVIGEEPGVSRAVRAAESLLRLVEKGEVLNDQNVGYCIDMLGAESYARLVERGSIEVAPLAYMRGRTLDDSFIILDEAQNTTCEQMKMFLTRLGFNSKMVITGDITQIDLPDGRRSGLKDAMRVLRNVDDISVFRFTEKDVVRHRLVQDIIRAYEKASAAK